MSNSVEKPHSIESLSSEAEVLLSGPEDKLEEEDLDKPFNPVKESEESIGRLEELVVRLNRFIQEQKKVVADLAQEGNNRVGDELQELKGDPNILILEHEADRARNELLGRVEEAANKCDQVTREAAKEAEKAQLMPELSTGVLDLDEFKKGDEIQETAEKIPAKDMEGMSEEPEKILEETGKPTDESEQLEFSQMQMIDFEVPSPDLDSDTEIRVKKSLDSREEINLSLHSRENVGLFRRLGDKAKRSFVDFYTRTLISVQGRSEIRGDQRLIKKSSDKIHILERDQAQANDKLEELKDQLQNIDEVIGRIGDTLRPREIKALEKSRHTLNEKIKKSQKALTVISAKKETEETRKNHFETSLAKDLAIVSEQIDKALEPYKQEIAKLENDRTNLVAEKESFETLVDDFSSRLNDLKAQVAGLEEMAMPKVAKKSFKAVLRRKITDIESALKFSQSNIDHLEASIIRINGRINKEDERINEWENTRSNLKIEAENKPELEREEIKSNHLPRDRTRQFVEKMETPVYSASAYIDKWNELSKYDGLTLDKETILASSRKELTLERLESLIRTIRFRGLSEKQLNKRLKEKTEILRANFGIH